MSDDEGGGLVKRAAEGLALRGRGAVGRLGETREQLAALAVAVAKKLFELSGQPVVHLLERLVDAMVASDVAAQELALFIEQLREKRGNSHIVAALIRHNLLLNGTFLALIEPLLSKGIDPPKLSTKAVERGRATMRALILELLGGGEVVDVQEKAALDAIDESEFPELCPTVWEWLQGCSTEVEDGRFLMNSYLLFVQSALLKTALSEVKKPLPSAMFGRHDPERPK